MASNIASTVELTAEEEIALVKKVLDVAQTLPEGSVRRAIVGPLRDIIAQIVAKASVLEWFNENKDYAPTKEEIEIENKLKDKSA